MTDQTQPPPGWFPSSYARLRADAARVITYANGACPHGKKIWDTCNECDAAIFAFEREQGRDPLDPEQVLKDRLKECEQERAKAARARAKLEGPIGAWHICWQTVVPGALVYAAASYISLAFALAAATYLIVAMMLYMANEERRRQVAIQEARRELEEWQHAYSKAVDKLHSEPAAD